MKRLLSTLLIGITLVATISAQESQKVVPAKKIYTPQIGDLGLSVDILSPVMTYVGNLFNNSTDNTFPTSFSGPEHNGNISISGKYFIYEDFALRASVSIDNTRTTSTMNIRDDAAFLADPTSVAQVSDAYTQSDNNMYLSLGAEIRRGYSRLQGFYGAQLICGFESHRSSYSYGNAITRANTSPTQGFYATPANNIDGNSRLLETNTTGGKSLLLGLGCFVGVEYFIMPKIAIGGEINLTGVLSIGGQELEKSEHFNSSSDKVEENTHVFNEGTNRATLNTHNFGNAFYVAFYF
ncbi:MAG: hypothetical protein PHS30_00030 [Bacteroidales bacterium]|nr:hypothetical protein [Bacteroidales bacterium]